MFEVVILAAGYSSRLGKNKMELLILDKPVLSHVIEAFYPLCDNIIVVGGHYYDEVKGITSQYSKVNLIRNPNYSLGMFSSILCGISDVSGDCFITPGDYPLLTTEMIRSIGNIAGDFVVPVYKGRRGHPVKLSAKAVKELQKEPATSNLKVFRDQCGFVETKIEDPAILYDIDTLENYFKVKEIKEGVSKE
jgi:molybdenum cofactor cytidylyltransferase